MKKMIGCSTIFLLVMLGIAYVPSTLQAAEKAQETIEKYPTKPVTLFIPYGAGGGTDRRFRIISSVMNQYLGQPLVLINKPGGGGTVATAEAAKAKPDGYTLMVWHSSAMTILPLTLGVPYDPINDFEYVIQLFEYNNHVAASSQAPFKDWPSFVKYAKANPGKVKFGLGDGAFAFGQIWAETVLSALGAKVTYIPFDSAVEAHAAAAGGHVQIASGTWTAAEALVKQGKLIPIIHTGLKDEFGYSGLEKYGLEKYAGGSRNGIVAPKGTPKEIVQKLEKAFREAVQDKSFLALSKKTGEIPIVKSGAELRQITIKNLEMMKETVSKMKKTKQ